MTFGRITKKDVRSAVAAWTPKGIARKDALKQAAAAGFRKNSSGSVPNAQAARFFQKLKNEHELKSRVGAEKISAYTSTAKRLVNAAKSKEDSVGAAALAKQRLEEKKEILKDAGLKVDANKRASSKAEIHVEALNKSRTDGAKTGGQPDVKVNMDRALDKSALEEFGLGLPGTDTAGYKKGVTAAVSQSERKTAASMMGLKPGFSLPHPAAAKPAMKANPAPREETSEGRSEAFTERDHLADEVVLLGEVDTATEESGPLEAPSPVPELPSADEAVDPYGG